MLVLANNERIFYILTMTERASTYSKIISPEEYNRIISFEHLYISASDRVIKELIDSYRPKERIAEVVEIGCGPARVLPLMAGIAGIHLTGVDHDSVFLDYAKQIVHEKSLPVDLVHANITDWKLGKMIDVCYSQGVHHHIGKKIDTSRYLNNVVSQLTKDGVYILSDEFLPEYVTEDERKTKAVIWYSHVIASAKRLHQDYLAQEEAKTLLDDLYEGNEEFDEVKSQEQIRLVLDVCTAIDQEARNGSIQEADRLAKEFFADLAKKRNAHQHGDITIDLSRGDFKICDSVLRKEIQKAGLSVIEVRKVGPVDTIGGMAVYVLKKGE